MKTKLTFTAFISLLIHLSLSSQTIIPAGPVSGQWDLDGSPYLVQGDLIVPYENTLTIEAGVLVKFMGHYRLLVNGILEAMGEEANYIQFTAEDTVTGWCHIYFSNDVDTDTSRMHYCIVEYGKPTGGTTAGYNTGGGISIEWSSVIISHCIIRNNYCSGDSPISPPMGGGISVAFSNPLIEHCTIINNQAEGNGGGIGLAQGCKPSIINCTLSGNSCGGDGGGIATYNFSGFMMKNTIVHGSENGSGIYFDYPDLTNVEIEYCDFFDNEAGDFSGDTPGLLGIAFDLNANGDPCDAYKNIFLDPSFVDPGEGDFHLNGDSPCIDAGDPESPPDPDGTCCDIGAYCTQQTGFSNTKLSRTSNLRIQPNPMLDQCTAMLDVQSPGTYKLAILNAEGKVMHILERELEPGSHKVELPLMSASKGIYHLFLVSDKVKETRKIVKLK